MSFQTYIMLGFFQEIRVFIYTTIEHFGFDWMLFFKEDLRFYMASFYLIKNTVKNANSNIVKLLQFNITMFFIVLIFVMVIYSCDGKTEFSASITPVFSVTWAFKNHSNILICWSRKSILKIVVLLNFLWINDT